MSAFFFSPLLKAWITAAHAEEPCIFAEWCNWIFLIHVRRPILKAKKYLFQIYTDFVIWLQHLRYKADLKIATISQSYVGDGPTRDLSYLFRAAKKKNPTTVSQSLFAANQFPNLPEMTKGTAQGSPPCAKEQFTSLISREKLNFFIRKPKN